MNTVGYTCQITAGFRAVELTLVEPIIHDHLAPHLAGAALQQALSDYQNLLAAQGPGRSLRVPARNRIMDDFVTEALQHLAAQKADATGLVQVVNLGCGMDTKPWRLQPPLAVHWFDVDQPAVMQLKQQLLQQAGAATSAPAGPTEQGQDTATAHKFPLLLHSWHPLAVDLSVTSLAAGLEAAGFRRDRPTLWIAEALIYYLPLDTACQLLSDMRTLSAPGSKLIATCIDKALQQAHLQLDEAHYFSAANVAWHFCMDDLAQGDSHTVQGSRGKQGSSEEQCGAAAPGPASEVGPPPASSRIELAGWRIQQQPPLTAAQLALERYGKETYVALYGGAECCFTAVPV